MKGKRKKRQRNFVAKELADRKFQQKIVPDKRQGDLIVQTDERLWHESMYGADELED